MGTAGYSVSVELAVIEVTDMKEKRTNAVGPSIKEVETAVEKLAPQRVRRFFRDLGPGLITGAADDDPSGISTYSVTGASFGYAPLWTALFSFPLMAAVQMVRGHGRCNDSWSGA